MVEAPLCYCKDSWLYCLHMEGGKKESAFQANSGGTSLTSKALHQEFAYLLLAQKDIQDSPTVVSLELHPE